MTEREDDGEARVARRVRSYLADEAPRSRAAVVAAAAMEHESPRRGSRFAATGAFATIVVVVAVALAAGFTRSLPPGGSGAPTASATASGPAALPSGVGSLYPDGLPRDINGEVVYRASDPVVVTSTASVLVAGWTTGWIIPSCPTSTSPTTCHSYAQLAESPGGPTYLMVEETGGAWPETGVVIRVQSEPTWQCPDTASCVASVVWGLGLVWQAGPSPTPLPPGGISEERAIELAHGHLSLSTFVSATAGRFSDLNFDPNIGPGFPVAPDALVWAIRFSGEATICSPVGVCASQATIGIVYLDYATGDFLTSGGFSPGP